jgi:hypothetical protein
LNKTDVGAAKDGLAEKYRHDLAWGWRIGA